MNQSTFYVDKSTDTFADVLLTYGVAALLDRLLRDHVGQRTVRVKDAGSVYAIELEAPIRDEYADVAWFCDVPFLQAGRKNPPEGWPAQVVNYDAEKDRRSQYFDARKQLPKEARRPGATRDEFPELATVENLTPRPDYDILAQVYQMSSIYAYTDVLINSFACRECFPELLRITLTLFAATPNDVDAAYAAWKSLRKAHKLKAKNEVTPVQILNPSMGKGVNRPKADRADSLTNPKSFWLLEYLKFWGMRMAGLPRIVKGGGDRKTYVLRPRNVTLETLARVYRPFNAVMWPNTAIKMDVLAAIRCTDVFLEQWLAGQLVDVRYGQQPGDHVSGLAVAFYKDMGNASTVLNLAEISVPQWMTVDTPEQAQAYQALLEEHRRVVDSLDEGRGDQYRLLQRYRDFLSGRILDPFFEFNAGYASLTMSRMERGQWAPRFSTQHLEVLIMTTEEKLSPILNNDGFQNVATAIRRSTVIPQYFKARGDKGPYAIRYGLGNDLLRRAAYPEQFIQALGEFLHEYNRETAQIHERYKGNPPVRRATVTTDDIQQVVTLIDEYGSPTVANLLVAFGYAREPREQEQGEDQRVSDEESTEE
ncbi:MAG TPA: hypothetical protein ENN19_18165 [Chloroflexi bacterium]|nr:hypothetical protein [Chloroflexota bacterium]